MQCPWGYPRRHELGFRYCPVATQEQQGLYDTPDNLQQLLHPKHWQLHHEQEYYQHRNWRGTNMTTVKEIESAILRLSPEELAVLREWFDEFDAQMWDKQFEEDAKSGKLDKLAEQAIADFQTGKFRELFGKVAHLGW